MVLIQLLCKLPCASKKRLTKGFKKTSKFISAGTPSLMSYSKKWMKLQVYANAYHQVISTAQQPRYRQWNYDLTSVPSHSWDPSHERQPRHPSLQSKYGMCIISHCFKGCVCVCVCGCVCFTILQGAEKIELPIEKDRTHPGILLGLPSFIS